MTIHNHYDTRERARDPYVAAVSGLAIALKELLGVDDTFEALTYIALQAIAETSRLDQACGDPYGAMATAGMAIVRHLQRPSPGHPGRADLAFEVLRNDEPEAS